MSRVVIKTTENQIWQCKRDSIYEVCFRNTGEGPWLGRRWPLGTGRDKGQDLQSWHLLDRSVFPVRQTCRLVNTMDLRTSAFCHDDIHNITAGSVCASGCSKRGMFPQIWVWWASLPRSWHWSETKGLEKPRSGMWKTYSFMTDFTLPRIWTIEGSSEGWWDART